jgi:hypothetical protein
MPAHHAVNKLHPLAMTRNKHIQNIQEGDNRLHPLKADTISLLNYLYILLVITFYINMYIVTPMD